MGVYSNNPDYWRGGSSSPAGFKIKIDKDAVELNVKHIERMLTSHPEMRQRIQEVIRKDVWAARNAVVEHMGSVFLNGDAAEARKAVRNIVYEKILGANLNILNMKRGTAQWKFRKKERKLDQNPHQRGGNRVKRNFNTMRMYGYEGKARGMILRWVNTGNEEKRTSRLGNRGAIVGRNFFSPLAQSALDVVSQHLAQIIEQEISKVYNENNTN